MSAPPEAPLAPLTAPKDRSAGAISLSGLRHGALWGVLDAILLSLLALLLIPGLRGVGPLNLALGSLVVLNCSVMIGLLAGGLIGLRCESRGWGVESVRRGLIAYQVVLAGLTVLAVAAELMAR